MPHLGTNQKSQKCDVLADLGRLVCSALVLGKVSFNQSKAKGDSPKGNQGTTTKEREMDVEYQKAVKALYFLFWTCLIIWNI